MPRWYALSLLTAIRCMQGLSRSMGLRHRPQEGRRVSVFLGWVRAIAVAQDKVRKGGIDQPILILHSARSNDGADTIWHEEYRRADLVLDVEDMKREGKALGRQVTIGAIEGGVHDLVLSDRGRSGERVRRGHRVVREGCRATRSASDGVHEFGLALSSSSQTKIKRPGRFSRPDPGMSPPRDGFLRKETSYARAQDHSR